MSLVRLVAVLGGALGSAAGLAAQSLALDRAAVVFMATAGGGTPAPQSVAIRSTTTGTARWTVTGSAAWLTVTPAAGTGPGSVTLSVQTAGLAPGVYHVQVVVTNGSVTKTVEVVLLIAGPTGGVPAPTQGVPVPPVPPPPPSGPVDPWVEILRGIGGGTPARYFVEFMFTGYSGLADGYPDCRVNTQGFDHMIGVLSGVETEGAPDDDVTYTGLMLRFTEVDFCETKPRPGRGPDELMWCTVDLHGEATMFVELEVYGEADRGAWLKAKPARGRTWRTTGGDCKPETHAEIEAAYPAASDGGGGSPSGQPILDGGSVKFYQNGRARLRVGDYPARNPDSIWSMRVIARLVP